MTTQDVADAKNASYKRKYDGDVAAYNQAAKGWQFAQTVNVQNHLAVQPFEMQIPRQLVVTINAEGHLEEDYAPADLTLVPALPKVPPPPATIDHWNTGATADKVQDTEIAEILQIVRRIDSKLPPQ